MSRKIMFRVWDKVRKVYLNDDHGFRLMYLRNGSTEFFNQDRWVFEQDTNLKDKNGKRIHEGDILRLYGRFVSAITWQDDFCGFRWYDNSGDGYCGLGKDNEEYYEVIGNIHENPELLGDEDE